MQPTPLDQAPAKLVTLRQEAQNAQDEFTRNSKLYPGMFGIASNSRFLNSKENRDSLQRLATTKSNEQARISREQIEVIKDTAKALRELVERDLSPRNLTLEQQLEKIANQTKPDQAAANKKWDAPVLIKACHELRTKLDFKGTPLTTQEEQLSRTLRSLQTELTAVHDARESKKGHGTAKADNVPKTAQRLHTLKRTLQIIGLVTAVLGTVCYAASFLFPPLALAGVALYGVSALCSAGLLAEKARKNRWRHSEYGIEFTEAQKKSGIKTATDTAKSVITNLTIRAAFVGGAAGLAKLFTNLFPQLPRLAKLPTALKSLIQGTRTIKSEAETATPLAKELKAHITSDSAAATTTTTVATATTAAQTSTQSTAGQPAVPQSTSAQPAATPPATVTAVYPYQSTNQTTPAATQIAAQLPAVQPAQPAASQPAQPAAPAQPATTAYPHTQAVNAAHAAVIAQQNTQQPVTVTLIEKNNTSAITAATKP